MIDRQTFRQAERETDRQIEPGCIPDATGPYCHHSNYVPFAVLIVMGLLYVPNIYQLCIIESPCFYDVCKAFLLIFIISSTLIIQLSHKYTVGVNGNSIVGRKDCLYHSDSE